MKESQFSKKKVTVISPHCVSTNYNLARSINCAVRLNSLSKLFPPGMVSRVELDSQIAKQNRIAKSGSKTPRDRFWNVNESDDDLHTCMRWWCIGWVFVPVCSGRRNCSGNVTSCENKEGSLCDSIASCFFFLSSASRVCFYILTFEIQMMIIIRWFSWATSSTRKQCCEIFGEHGSYALNYYILSFLDFRTEVGRAHSIDLSAVPQFTCRKPCRWRHEVFEQDWVRRITTHVQVLIPAMAEGRPVANLSCPTITPLLQNHNRKDSVFHKSYLLFSVCPPAVYLFWYHCEFAQYHETGTTI